MRLCSSRRLPLLALVVAAALGACDRSATPDTEVAYTGVIDSSLPIDTLLARFRAAIVDTPTALSGGEASPERLARRFVAAIAGNDTATVQRLVINRAEFAWLYYPHTRFTRRPYELGPELLWMQILQNSEKGVTRMIRRYGGQPLRFNTLACPDSAETEGPNTILTGCTVNFAVGDSAARTMRIFGSIIARDGQYKFVGYSNDL